MTQHNNFHRQRMRDRLMNGGIDNFNEHEVLEMLLFLCIPFKDTNKIAHELIDTFGSFAAVLDAPADQLVKVKGVGEITAVNLKLIRDSYYRYNISTASSISPSSPAQMVNLAQTILADSNIERMVVLFVDGMGRLLGKTMYTSNSTGSIYVNNKDIVAGAMSFNARGVMLFHNHVRSAAFPSNNDIKYTEGLYNTLKGIDVIILEHMIFGENSDCYSMRNSGQIKELMEKYNK